MSDPTITGTKQVFIAWTNTDLTEGRGWAKPLAVCAKQATAIRLGKKGSVQGCDCNVTEVTAVKIGGAWYAPVYIHESTREDDKTEEALTAKAAALAKARSLGLSEDDLRAMTRPTT